MYAGRTIIHIGLPRCGSTFLQRSVFPKLGEGVKVVSPAESDRRIVDFLNERFILRGRNIFLEPITAAERSELAAILADYRSPLLLISAEGLVGDSFDNMLPMPHLMAALRELFGEPEILLVIRRQSSLLQSYYRYALEEGYHGSFRKFLNYKGGEFGPFLLQRYGGINIAPATLNYDSLQAYLERIFGSGRVHVVPFEGLQRDLAMFIRQLETILGLAIEAEKIRPSPVNQGVRGGEVLLLRALNKVWDTRLFGIPLLPDKPFLAAIERRSGGPQLLWRILRAASVRMSPMGIFRLTRPLLGPLITTCTRLLGLKDGVSDKQVLARIDEAMAVSNAALDQRLRGDLAEHGYCK